MYDRVASGKSGAEKARQKRARDEAEAARVAALPPGAEDELEVMRHVKRDQRDLTYQHWESRKWKEIDQPGWQKAWAMLERAARSTEPSSPPTPQSLPAGPGPQPPEETPERIIEQLGESWTLAQEYMANRDEFLAWKAKR